MKRKKAYFYDNFQLIVFTISYILSCFFLYGIFIYFSTEFDLIFKVIFSLGFAIGSVFLWSYLFVLFSIPQKLAGAFDKFKNKISTVEISSPNSFSTELTAFLISFFNFSFFDVQYSAVKTVEGEMIFSSKDIKNVVDWEIINYNASKSAELQKNGRLKIDGSNFSCYTTPIFFNNKYLGFFTVITKQSLGKLSLKFLTDLEENFIDDQLMRFYPQIKS